VKKFYLIIFIIFSVIMFFITDTVLSSETAITPGEKYTFTSDWFTPNIPNWTRLLNDMKGKPNLTYLEIGTYEGRSFFWVLDNILTDPSSRAIGIDTFDKIFDSDPEKTFKENLRRSGRSSNIRIIKGLSQEKLRGLDLNSVDLIYIDCDHKIKGVLEDAILSWALLKEGGIMIFDDYKLDYDLPMEMRPEFAVDVFQTLYRDELQFLLNDYQVFVKKNRSYCNESMGSIERMENPVTCSRLGSYIYYWKPRKLYDASTNKEIVIKDTEKSIIENTLEAMKLGFRLDVEKKEVDQYRQLLNRLGVQDIGVSAKGN
jgi:predicted O-methyltransferase YrrM